MLDTLVKPNGLFILPVWIRFVLPFKMWPQKFFLNLYVAHIISVGKCCSRLFFPHLFISLGDILKCGTAGEKGTRYLWVLGSNFL